MTKGIKIYAMILVALLLVFAVNIVYEDPKVAELNDQLKSIQAIRDYPYPFRVLRIDSGVATMSTPRSADVSAPRILEVLFPEMRGKSVQSTEFQDKQSVLAKVQNLAKDTVLSNPDIDKVRWELDTYWLSQHDINLNL